MRLMDMTTMMFVCALCQKEVVQLGNGEDGAPPEPKTKAAFKVGRCRLTLSNPR